MNLICIAQNILESCFINGLWTAWGPMGVYFKQNDFFVDYCTEEGLFKRCLNFDVLFQSKWPIQYGPFNLAIEYDSSSSDHIIDSYRMT